jgi:hypothetical protein
MSGGGGKGGKQTTEVQIPQYLQDASKRNIARAEQVQRLGFTPYTGPQVAAFNPTQLAAMQSNIGAAEAFGLMQPNTVTAAQGMPTPQTFADGSQGYSSMPLYDQALAEMQRRNPAQVAAYNKLFV